MCGACGTFGGGGGCVKGLRGETEGRRPLGKHRHTCENNQKTGVKENDCEGMDWIDLAWDSGKQGAVVNMAVNRRVS